jgi:hypothetical protein
MSRFYPTLMIGLAIVALINWFGTLNTPSPQKEAMSFLSDLRDGNLGKAVRHFGGNTCRCPAKGGWGSYLVYASGQEPNLAFLVGHQFMASMPRVTFMKNDRSYILPWEKPEDSSVDVDIDFATTNYKPFFLPLPLAYGKDMSNKDFEAFVADPSKDAERGFTLRLRPSLYPNAIKTDKRTISPESKNEFRALEDLFDSGKSTEKIEYPQVDQKMIKEALGESALEFITPKDMGNVLGEDGKPLPLEKIGPLMPRLVKTTIRMHIVRAGKLEGWTVFHFKFIDSDLVEQDNRKMFYVKGTD